MNCSDQHAAGVGRLALGTAQWGMRYGVANRSGQPSPEAVAAILECALLGGIRRLDTASGYGRAECLIGDYLREHDPEREVVVVTKVGADGSDDQAALRAAVVASARRLGGAPDAVLLHDPRSAERWNGPVGYALRLCRSEGSARAIGISVYHPEQFAAVLELADVDVVQAPYSVLDRRLELTGLLAQAHARDVCVMLRSVFLQGLLLLEPEGHPAWLQFAAPRLRRWHALCAQHGVRPLRAALRFVLERTAPALVVVGCESEAQAGELLGAADGPDLPAALVSELEELATSDTRLLDPTGWPR